MDVKAVEIAIHHRCVAHIVCAKNPPIGSGEKVAHSCIAQIVHQKAVARMVGMGIAAYQRHRVEHHIGTVVYFDDAVIIEHAFRCNHIDVPKRNSDAVLNIHQIHPRSGSTIAQKSDVAEEQRTLIINAATPNHGSRFSILIRKNGRVAASEILHSQQFFAEMAVGVILSIANPGAAIHHLNEPSRILESWCKSTEIALVNGAAEGVAIGFNWIHLRTVAEQKESFGSALYAKDHIVEVGMRREGYANGIGGYFQVEGVDARICNRGSRGQGIVVSIPQHPKSRTIAARFPDPIIQR